MQDAALIGLTGFRPAPQKRATPTKTASAFYPLRIQIEAYRQGGPEPPRELILKAIGEAPDASDVVAALSAAVSMGMLEISEHLPRLLQSTNTNVVSAACDAIGKLRINSMHLLPLFQNPSPAVRRAAVRSVGLLRITEAKAELQRLIDTDESDVVILSARAALSLLK